MVLNLIRPKCLSGSVGDGVSVISAVYMIKSEEAWQLYHIG